MRYVFTCHFLEYSLFKTMHFYCYGLAYEISSFFAPITTSTHKDKHLYAITTNSNTFETPDLPKIADCFTTVYSILKNMYKLKDSGRTWHDYFDKRLIDLIFFGGDQSDLKSI